MTGFEVVNFGCRLNAYEAETIKAMGEAEGLSNALVFNTCAVTAEAERQARQAIRRARRDHPTARIIVTGCAAQIDPQSFAAARGRPRARQCREAAAATWRAEATAGSSGIRVNDIMAGQGDRARL